MIDARATGDMTAAGSLENDYRAPVPVAAGDRARTSERTLRIVFPAHVDETGTLHDDAVAWAVVENPRWAAELRRKVGEDTAPPLMRQLRRKLKAVQAQIEATSKTHEGTAAEQPAAQPEAETFDLGQPFQPSSSLEDMALGLPLLFFLLISGGDAGVFFAHLANISDRFLGAEQGRQIGFLDEFKFVLIGVATLVVVWRLPRFINDLERELSGEKL